MQKIFRYRKICRTEKSTLRSIQENETKNFPTENGNSPLPPYALKFPISEILWNTKGSPTNFFGLVRLKFSNRKSWNSPIMHTIYGCPNLSKSLKGFPEKFRHCETKKSTKSWYLMIQKIFDTRQFLKHKGPPMIFLGTVRQKRSTKSWYRYYPKSIWFQNVSETQKGSLTMFFGDLWQTISDGKTWQRPSYPHVFSILESFWNKKAFLTYFFATVRLKICDGKSWNSLI